jgi:hypothetical protein
MYSVRGRGREVVISEGPCQYGGRAQEWMLDPMEGVEYPYMGTS